MTESEVAAAEDSLGGKDGLWPPSDTSVLEDAGMAELEEAEEEEGEEEEEGQGGSEGDEEAWLVAMEKGQLDETGYLPRRSGPNLTARQVSCCAAACGDVWLASWL